MYSMYLVQYSSPESNWQVPLFKQLASMLVQLAFRVNVPSVPPLSDSKARVLIGCLG